MRILIADDHGIVRQGLKALLERRDDIEVVAEAEDGRQAVELARRHSPDAVIMDITMPVLNGLDATRAIIEHNPDAKVIMLSMHLSQQMVKEALGAGVCAYVLKSSLYDEVIRALDAVAQGQCYLSPRVASEVVDVVKATEHPPQPKQPPPLSTRERQVVQLVAEGLTVKQMAQRLHISPKTADANRRAVMNKLGISSIADLVKYAIREGITSTDF